jgi:hypothetical protein
MAYCHVICIKVRVGNDRRLTDSAAYSGFQTTDVEWVADILDVPRVFLLVEVKVVNCERNSMLMKLIRDQTHNPLN